jgi:hypothetical protein
LFAGRCKKLRWSARGTSGLFPKIRRKLLHLLMKETIPPVLVLFASAQSCVISTQRIQDIGRYLVVVAVGYEPVRDYLAGAAELETAFPHLGQEQESENFTLTLDFGETFTELPLPPFIGLVGVLCVKEHVD